MPSTSPDAQVRLGVHPAHPTAVVARLTGSRHRTAQALLAAHGFDSPAPLHITPGRGGERNE
ncbi:hypothetical protein [Streptomyces bobili]|uniref:hypothetical protein n=1 Tax=Streptomyces bobili TaxID=67280 RepID=UPI0037202A51